MRHPSEGVLRRLVDEPAGVADSDREHVTGCKQCLGRLAAARDNGASGDAATTARVHHRSLALWRRPLVAALAVAVTLTAAGTAAANDWLPIFQTKAIAPVSFSAGDLVGLPDLHAYGEVKVTGNGGLRRVPNAAAAAVQTGLDVPKVKTLPRGVSGESEYQVAGKLDVTFTFSADRAGQAAEKAGKTLPPPPPGLDGGQLRLSAGPGVVQVWSSDAGAPALIVGRAVAPSASSSGVPFATARDYLLSLPGVPEKVAAQLRTFAGDGSTLPLPVPADQVTTSSATVNGNPATVLTARDQTMAAVVWVKDGIVTAVAGSLDSDELLPIARELR
ncbi:hypothetical protein EV644_101106 [Kribbella orskensis]|uniref:DUF4367 domain-containing protein n=1 Tax=Kribbella orskensis TaxID=2512216 RepID=A0ABY2BU28_9ACTN|nr:MULTISPECIES: hypothetical protein [Kribbella]TCN44756.1 hypothetical protein EV642_101883 [Kribbella sp. VKM Ac-2500]TCO31466.1 hypothetical protein EV644_101106 [Kribbella orskensis]